MLVVVLTACSSDNDSFGPPPNVPFDPEAVANSIFSLRFAASNVALVQVGTITDALGMTTPGFNLAPERGVELRHSIAPSFQPGTLRRLVADRTLRLSQGANSVPLFPINFLGETFVYDIGLDGYIIDGRSGAPQNGVRFTLYRLDPSSLLPSLPLAPFGFVDLIDQSDAVSTRLRIVAFDTAEGGSLPLADYLIDGAYGTASAGVVVNLLSDGFLIDHNGRFDFQLDETLETDGFTNSTFVTLEHAVISDEGTRTLLEVDGEIANDGSFSDLFFKFDIAGSAGATLVDMRIVNGVQDGVMQHGGRTEVLISGPVDLPVYIPANGGAFGPSEIAALDEILFGIDDVLIMSDEVFRPLGEIFGVR